MKPWIQRQYYKIAYRWLGWFFIIFGLIILALFTAKIIPKYLAVGVITKHPNLKNDPVLLRNNSALQLIDRDGKVELQWQDCFSGEIDNFGNFLCFDPIISIRDMQDKKRLNIAGTDCVNHDIHRVSWNKIYFLCRHTEKNANIIEDQTIISDTIVEMSLFPPKKLSVWKLNDHVHELNNPQFDFPLKSPHRKLSHKKWANKKIYDWSHTNSLEINNSEYAKMNGFPAESALISMANLNQLAVVDLNTRAIIWTYANPILFYQHHARFQPDGSISLYNNGTRDIGSFGIRLNPKTKKIIKKYSPVPKSTYFKRIWIRSGGSMSLLDNGDVLFSHAIKGQVMQINKSGNLVWHYRHPGIAKLTWREKLLNNLLFTIEDSERQSSDEVWFNLYAYRALPYSRAFIEKAKKLSVDEFPSKTLISSERLQ